MTVRELIEALHKCDPEMIVLVEMEQGGWEAPEVLRKWGWKRPTGAYSVSDTNRVHESHKPHPVVVL